MIPSRTAIGTITWGGGSLAPAYENEILTQKQSTFFFFFSTLFASATHMHTTTIHRTHLLHLTPHLPTHPNPARTCRPHTYFTTMALAAMLVAGTVSAYPSYFGQKMTVLAIEGNVGLGIRDRANAFNELTGAQVEVVLTGRDEQVVEQATELSTGTVLYDAYVSTASDMIAYQVQNLLPLNDLIEKDEEIRWSDIGSWFRTLGVYNNEILALPLDGDFHLMYYRQDVLAKAGLAPPKTLEEMVSVAKAINGTDMDGDGHGDVGFCIGFGEPSQGYMFVSLLLSLMQSKGTSQGYLFDPSTMEALQDNPAMADGLRMLAELVTVGSNKDLLRTFGWDVRSLFTSGKCGIIIDWGDIAGLSIGSYVNGLTGMARLPGSRKVWDREEQAYRACDTTLCPFGGEEGINSAIYAFGGWSYQINRKIKEERHQFVYDFGSYMCSPKISAEDAVDGTTGLEPYRYSHMLAGITIVCFLHFHILHYRHLGGSRDGTCKRRELRACSVRVSGHEEH